MQACVMYSSYIISVVDRKTYKNVTWFDLYSENDYGVYFKGDDQVAVTNGKVGIDFMKLK